MIDINWLRQQSLMNGFGQQDQGGGGDYSIDTSNLFDDPNQNPQNDAAFRDVTFPQQSANEMPQQIQPPTVEPVPTYQNQPFDYEGRIKKIMDQYTPETQASDRLNNLLNQAPDYQHYNPGILRGIGGIGLALGPGGYKASQEMMYAPIARDMAAWKEEAAPFQAAATAENARNTNERTLLGNLATSTVNAQRADQQYAIGEEKNRIAGIRAEAYSFKEHHPDWKYVTKGTHLVATSPDGQNIRDFGPIQGVLSDRELADLKGQWGVEAAAARGAAAVQTAQAGAVASNKDLVVVDGVTYQRNPDRSLTPVEGAPSGTPTKIGTPQKPAPPMTPGNKIKTQGMTLQELWDTDEYARPWIEPDTTSPTGGLRIKQLPAGANEGDKYARQRVVDKVYGKEVPHDISLPSEGGGTPTPGRGENVPFGAGQTNDQRSKAIEYLNQNGLPITEANIAHAIKTRIR